MKYEEIIDSIDVFELAKIFIDGVTPGLKKSIEKYEGINPYEYPLQTKITNEQTIEIMLHFFESIDYEYAKKVRGIINNNNPEIILEAEEYNGRGSSVSNPNKKPITVYVPIRGNISQLYEAVHEFTHILDIDNGDTDTRRILGEVAPQCMERLLDEFLLEMTDAEMQKYGFERGTIEKDIKDRRLATFTSRFHNAEGVNEGRDVEVDSRYMLAQIYSAHFNGIDKREKNKKIKTFIDCIINDDFDGANACFGLSINQSLKLNREVYVRNAIYQTENNGLMNHIKNEIIKKIGNWDLGVPGQSDDLLTMLMYEYATSIEKLTNGTVGSIQVVSKLISEIDILRFGDFKPGVDDGVIYDGKYVATSDDYKIELRAKHNMGAHTIIYDGSEGKKKIAIAFFDNRQTAKINGKIYKLSGIDLQDLADIRQTAFHEWTHVMERCKIKTSELSKLDIVYTNGDSTYINSAVDAGMEKSNYDDYVANVDDLLKRDDEVTFEGISTIELNSKKNPNKRIMHNLISEGATEFIAREVMHIVGEKVKHPNRYARQVKIVGDIFKGKGLAESISTYFTTPHKMMGSLENIRVQDKDMLHYISDYINSSHLYRLFNRFNIDEYGNVIPGKFSEFIYSARKKFSRKDAILLPQGDSSLRASERKSAFLESIVVEPNDLSNEGKQSKPYEKLKIEYDDKNGPNLDD